MPFRESLRRTSASRADAIVGIGNAGNPLIQSGIDMVIGAATEVVAGEGRIVTAGGLTLTSISFAPNRSSTR